jgi:hypothetical protein
LNSRPLFKGNQGFFAGFAGELPGCVKFTHTQNAHFRKKSASAITLDYLGLPWITLDLPGFPAPKHALRLQLFATGAKLQPSATTCNHLQLPAYFAVRSPKKPAFTCEYLRVLAG